MTSYGALTPVNLNTFHDAGESQVGRATILVNSILELP
jgi:hypothetical protein